MKNSLLILSALFLVACSGSEMPETTSVPEADVKEVPARPAVGQMQTLASGLKYQLTSLGSGPRAKAGDRVQVHYSGRLSNGNEFDSSHKRGKPFAFKLGAGRVIAGWDEGIAQLHVGDKAMLFVPSELGYGARGAGGVIPPDADLIFEVELVSID